MLVNTLGWISFAILILATVMSIANEKAKGGHRLVTTILNVIILVYISLNLFK